MRDDGALLGPWNPWLQEPKFGKPVWELTSHKGSALDIPGPEHEEIEESAKHEHRRPRLTAMIRPVLQRDRKNASIHAYWGYIWGIPGQNGENGGE
jgi:hypothetical protein